MKTHELHFKSGTRLYLQRNRPDGVTQVMPCVLLHCIDRQKMVVRPLGDESFASFTTGETYHTRIVSNDKRYAFTTIILARPEGKEREIHLSYPTATNEDLTRETPRFLIAKPVRLSLRSGNKTLTVHIHDISRSGACLIAETSLAKGDDVLNIELRDPFEQSLITLRCLVRYVMFDIVDGVINYRHGVEFQFRDNEEQLQLENFIEYLLHERYAVPLSML